MKKAELLKHLSINFDQNKSQTGFEQFEKPSLSYLNKDSKIITDSYYDSAFDYGSMIYTTIQDNRRKSYQYLSLLMQNGILSSIVDVLSSEAGSGKIEIFSKDTNDDYAETIDYILSRLKELKINTVLRRALRSNYIFGGSVIFFEIDGKNDAEFLNIPFTLSPLTVNQDKKLSSLNIIDPIYCVPVEINTINPMSSDFYVPSKYTVLGNTVDHSRLWRIVTNEVPTNIKPMYNFFGISLVQQCEEYIYRFEEVTQNINAIIKRMRTSVFSTSMTDLLTGDCSDDELNIVKDALNTRYSMLHAGNNNSMLFLDKEMESFQEINTNISGLSDLLSSISEELCIVPRIPATKLLGISPRGMNATGESDLNNFYDEIKKIQESYLLPIVQRVVDILYMEATGKKNDCLYPVFEEKNLQELNSSQVEASFVNDTIRAVEVGIISQEEARSRLSNLGWDLDSELPIEEDLDEEFQTI